MTTPKKRGRKRTAAQMLEVYDLIEHTMSTEGWSGRIERGLARSLEVSARQVRRYQATVLEQLSDGRKRLSQEQKTSEFLSRLAEAQTEMRKNGRWGPMVQAMNLEARVLGIDKVKVEIGRSPPIIHLGLPSFDEIEKTPNDDSPAE